MHTRSQSSRGGSIPTLTLHPEDYLHKEDWTIETIPLAQAQFLTETFHYAKGGSNTATFRHGLLHKDSNFPLGVAWWIPPTRTAAFASWQGKSREVLSLSRLVICPRVPKNGATFLLMQSVRKIRQDGRYPCLITYADTWQGHTGGIYRAAGWEYLGLTAPESIWIDSTGRMVARKAGPSTRTRSEMESLGLTFLGRFPKHKYRLILRPPESSYES